MEEKPTAQIFKYENPNKDRKKTVVRLAKTDLFMAMVQIVRVGGENNLHSHAHLDGFWMVLKGKARFYGESDELLGEFGPCEGIVVPRNFPYWFESASEEELEILQVEASDIPLHKMTKPDRINHKEPTATQKAEIIHTVDAE